MQAEAERLDPGLRSERGVRLHDSARSWYVGTLGEIAVGRMLDELGAEWLVLHSVPIGAKSTDVDHLAIGPAGVFVVNTKHHARSSVWIGDRAEKVNTTVQHFARRSASEARGVAIRLGHRTDAQVAVSSVVTFVDARRIKDSRPQSDRHVSFVPADDLVPWLLSLPRVLSPAQLGLVRLAAEEPGTWHVDPRAADAMRVMPRFERLRFEVERFESSFSRRAPRTPLSTNTVGRDRPTTNATPARSTRSTTITLILAVVALVILIPNIAMAAGLLAADPTAFWVGVAVLGGLLGLFTGGSNTKKRRRR